MFEATKINKNLAVLKPVSLRIDITWFAPKTLPNQVNLFALNFIFLEF